MKLSTRLRVSRVSQTGTRDFLETVKLQPEKGFSGILLALRN